MDALWAQLTTADPVVARKAIATLVARPTDAVPFLRQHLRPVPKPDPAELARLIGDLDHKQFTVRDSATRKLERLGEPAEAAIRQALAAQPSPERRRRLEEILETQRRNRLHPPPEHLRLARAVEVLEEIGTPAARELLQALAQGAPEATLTRDAQGALERLAR
jgi:hypothetical protein